MKRRLIAALCGLPVLLVLDALAAYNLHVLLLRQFSFTWHPRVIFCALAEIRSVRLFFAAFAAMSVLFLLASLISGAETVRYRNATVTIVPRITIPAPAGNGEYGTAWFMPAKELRHVFSYRRLSELKKLQEEVNKCEKSTARRPFNGLGEGI